MASVLAPDEAGRREVCCPGSPDAGSIRSTPTRMTRVSYYNEYDVDEIVAAVRRSAPDLEPYATALTEWRDIVNANSDGWSHWSGGHNAANKILGLFEGARHGGWVRPTPQECARAFSPIKSAATRHNLPQPTLPKAAVRR